MPMTSTHARTVLAAALAGALASTASVVRGGEVGHSTPGVMNIRDWLVPDPGLYGAVYGPDDKTGPPTGILPIPDHSVDLRERAFLAGDLFDSRKGLAENGVQFAIDWTQTLQSVVNGGRDTGTDYGGNLNYIINLDLDRMGVMPGALVKIRGETRYGENANGIAGPLLPVSLQGLIPISDDGVAITVTDLTYFQFFSKTFGVFLGKFDTFDGDPNAFASGRGATQFLNMNFVLGSVHALLPYSTLGGGAVWLPTPDITVSTSLFNTQDSSTTSGFGDIGDGWTSATEADFQYRLGTLPGGTNVSFAYSGDNDFTNFNGRFTFEPGQGIIVPTRDSTWSLVWSGWQYLHTHDMVEGPVNLQAGRPTVQGFGLFWRAGFADDDTNPVNWSLNGGIGGMGVIPGREHDTFGVGYYYLDIKTSRLTNAVGFDSHSQGFEAFYNIAITPAVHFTLDAQVVSSPVPNADTGVILGMRLGLVF